MTKKCQVSGTENGGFDPHPCSPNKILLLTATALGVGPIYTMEILRASQHNASCK